MRYKFVNKRNRRLIAFLDVAGFFIWALAHIFRPGKILNQKPVPESVRKILLIRADYIGDVFLTTHTLKAIRKRFPEAEITFLVSQKSKQILKGNPHIDRVIAYSPFWFFHTPLKKAWTEFRRVVKTIRAEKFDLAADFRGDIRNILLLMVLTGIPHRVSFAASGGWFLLSCIAGYQEGMHEAAYHTQISRAMGAFTESGTLPKLCVTEKDRLFIRSFLIEQGISSKEKIAVIQPGARKGLRVWPQERYAAVAKALIKTYGFRVVLTGTPAELPVIHGVQDLLGGRAVVGAGSIKTLQELTALFERSSLFVGVSSGPSHLAASVGLSTALIFGPETLAQWRPLGNRHAIMKHEFPCSPCNQRRACPLLGRNCIKSVGVKEVLYGIDLLLKGPLERRTFDLVRKADPRNYLIAGYTADDITTGNGCRFGMDIRKE